MPPFSWPSERWLPKKALQNIPETDDLDIAAQGGVLILRPATVGNPGSRLATVRQNSKDIGIVPSHGREGTEAAGGDLSRSRHERHHFRSPALQPTGAIRRSLATQPPSASCLCPYAAATTTNDKDRMRWAGFQLVKHFGLSARYKRGFTCDEERVRWAAGEAERSRK